MQLSPPPLLLLMLRLQWLEVSFCPSSSRPPFFGRIFFSSSSSGEVRESPCLTKQEQSMVREKTEMRSNGLFYLSAKKMHIGHTGQSLSKFANGVKNGGMLWGEQKRYTKRGSFLFLGILPRPDQGWETTVN